MAEAYEKMHSGKVQFPRRPHVRWVTAFDFVASAGFQLLGQHLMHEGDDNRSFTHGSCDALDVAFANISDREDAGQAGLQ